MLANVKELFFFNLRLLSFRTTRTEFDSFSNRHLLFGLFCTWLVGMGRWWDDPGARLVQHLGLGSVVYVFILSGIIWLLVLPLTPRNWSYKHVLTFVSLTSLPAALYAIPVERFVSLDAAITLNTLFLGVVAVWRVSLFLFYLGRHGALHWFYRVVVGILPLCAIVFTLAVLNLHRVVFNVMGGLREVDRAAHDGEYGLLFGLALLSYLSILPLLAAYFGIIVHAHRLKLRAKLNS
jgi:hypothetical protein